VKRVVFLVIGRDGGIERELIRERVRAGLRNACAKGRSWAGRASSWTP
jgi:hypothetical protein